MCNLYSMTRSQEAMRRLFKVRSDLTGNLPPMPAIFPDYMAPIVRRNDWGDRRLEMMRWGMPCSPQYGEAPVTTIHDTLSPHWRRWLGPESRCLVPATSFSEYTDNKPKVLHWFAVSEDRPLFAFAGIWTPWKGTRGTKANPVEGEHQVFGFLTTEANGVVAPVHSKAMPVLLTTEKEFDIWLSAPWKVAAGLQRPLPDEMLQIVARREKQDGAPVEGRML